MDLLLSAEQEQVAESIASFLSAEVPVSRLLDRARDHALAERSLWPRYAELGWFGLGMDEDLGGIGYGPAELALLCREVGRALASPNILATRLAAEVAARTGDAALAEALVAGERQAAIANATGPARIGPQSEGRFQVMGADGDDVLVAWSHDGMALFERADFGEPTPAASLDPGVPLAIRHLSGARPFAWLPAGEAPLPALAAVMVAAMHCGVADAAFATAIDYVKLREQFGKVIGSFQAVKHHCADMALAAEAAWAQTAMAALCLDRADTRDFEAAAARHVANRTAHTCAALNVQLHGGLGFADEGGAHLFVKRARLLEQLGPPARSDRATLLNSSLMA